jgi:hypothetical protein
MEREKVLDRIALQYEHDPTESAFTEALYRAYDAGAAAEGINTSVMRDALLMIQNCFDGGWKCRDIAGRVLNGLPTS